MARPRQYPDDDATNKARQAARQAAFRQRSVLWTGPAWRSCAPCWSGSTRQPGQLRQRVTNWRPAVRDGTPEATLRRLCEHWEPNAGKDTPHATDGQETGI